jgi:hypothetical protein
VWTTARSTAAGHDLTGSGGKGKGFDRSGNHGQIGRKYKKKDGHKRKRWKFLLAGETKERTATDQGQGNFLTAMATIKLDNWPKSNICSMAAHVKSGVQIKSHRRDGDW